MTIDEISVGDPFDHTKYDLLFIGGGQDFEQEVLLEDLHRGKDEEIRRAVADGTVVLAICGGYQMLGKYYQTYTGERLDYIGAVDSTPWAKKSGSLAITPLIRNSVE